MRLLLNSANLKSLAEQQEAALKATKAKIETISKTELPELLEAHGVESTKDDGIGTVYLQHRVFANVKAEDQERFHEYLKENGFADLIRPTVHPGTLTAWAKEQLENGKALPEFIQAAFVTQATLRRS